MPADEPLDVPAIFAAAQARAAEKQLPLQGLLTPREAGERGLLPSDLLPWLRRLANPMRR